MSKEKQYVQMIIDTKEWHENKVGQLKLLIEKGAESKIMVQGEDGKQVEMPKEHVKGFIMGVTIALEVFGKFPINITKQEG